jgi:hypothetical protein
MSKVAIEGNASGTGTLTIAAPNTNSNFTLSLPTNTGTIQVSGNPISGTTGSFSGDLSFNSGYGSAAVAYGCRAWARFDGTTSPGTILASGNVSSVTKNSTGDFTINFTTAMPDANFAAMGSGTTAASSGQLMTMRDYATTSVRVQVKAPATDSFSDLPNNSISVFR